jgi:hypothetical protein
MKAAGPQAGRASTWGLGGLPIADIALPTRSGRLLDFINAGAGNSTSITVALDPLPVRQASGHRSAFR